MKPPPPSRLVLTRVLPPFRYYDVFEGDEYLGKVASNGPRSWTAFVDGRRPKFLSVAEAVEALREVGS